MKITKYLLVALVGLTLSSCSIRLVDFTAISSKNVALNINRAEGKQVEGSESYFLGIGWNIKDALDEAISSAGPEYDMLIDGVVRYSSYPFLSVVKVEGIAVSSESMRTAMTENEYNDWLAEQNVFDAAAQEELKK